MMLIFSLIRIKQWTKNLICFAGVLFGNNLFNFEVWVLAFQAFVVFCLTSSSIYICNDIFDIKADSKHPRKKYRAIASGKVSIKKASIIALVFVIFSLIYSYKLNLYLFAILLLYICNNIFYNLVFKMVPIADAFSIAFGFIMRLISGIFVIGDTPTSWIFLCTIFLALFLAFSKRKSEFVKINTDENYSLDQRPVLKLYNEKLIDDMVSNSSIGAILSYALFTTISGENSTLVLTVPIVYYAISHYKNILFEKNIGEEPETVLLNDRVILFCITTWFILYISIKYFDLHLFS